MLNTPPYPQIPNLMSYKNPLTSQFMVTDNTHKQNQISNKYSRSIDKSIVTTLHMTNQSQNNQGNDQPKFRPSRQNIQSRFHSISPVPSHRVIKTEPQEYQLEFTPVKKYGTIQTVCSPSLSPTPSQTVQSLSHTNKKISESLFLTLQQMQQIKTQYEQYQQRVRQNYIKKEYFEQIRESLAKLFEENQCLIQDKKELQELNRKMQKQFENEQIGTEIQKFKREIYDLNDRNQNLQQKLSILQKQSSIDCQKFSSQDIMNDSEVVLRVNGDISENIQDIDLENLQKMNYQSFSKEKYFNLNEENQQILLALQQANQQVAKLKEEKDQSQLQIKNLKQENIQLRRVEQDNNELIQSIQILRDENQQLTEFCENFVKDNKKLHEQLDFYQSNSQSMKSIKNNETFSQHNTSKEEINQLAEKDKIILMWQTKYGDLKKELYKVKDQLQNYVNVVKEKTCKMSSNKENIPFMNSDKKK